MNQKSSDTLAMSRRRMLSLLGQSGALAAVAAGGFNQAAADTAAPGTRLPSLQTRLTQQYGTSYPFVSAGMGFVSYPPLVSAVSNAGGIGVLGNAIEPPPSTQLLIRMIKASTNNLFGIDFIHDNTAFGPATTDAHIAVCIAEQIRLVVFHFNTPPKSWLDQLHAAGAKVWLQTGSVEQAKAAVDLGIDAIIAQGVQAGGHNRSTTRTINLLHDMVSAVSPALVLASGGIATGADVVEALANGADGVWVGTRMLASTEAYAHPDYKQRLIQATGHATAITTAFGPEYPNVPYRVLRTPLVQSVLGHENEIPAPQPTDPPIGQTLLFPFTLRVPYSMPKFSAVVPTPDTTGQFDQMGFPAGEDSVKKIKMIKPAADIIAEMMSEARGIIEEQLAASSGA